MSTSEFIARLNAKPDPNNHTHPSGLTVRAADLTLSKPPRWAWDDRLVLGYLNLLLGNEGVGKGTLVAWLIGRLTHGTLPGDLKGHPCGVGIVGDEDSFDDVWAPRLHAAGADLSRVRLIERPGGGFVNLAEDRDKLRAVVRSEEIKLLFFDALLDNLGAGTDDWRAKAVREALQPARYLAREMEIVTLGSLHPNKRGDSFRALVAGSSAFNAVSRSSLLLAEHPDDEDRRVVVRGKGNLSKKPSGVDFEITSCTFTANGHDFNVPQATGFAVNGLTVEDLIEPSDTLEKSKVGDAEQAIRDLLPETGWHPAKPITDQLKDDYGIDERTARRAKNRAGIIHRRSPEFQGGTEWSWPTADTHRTSAQSVPTVRTVRSAASGGSSNDHNRNHTPDTADTQDSPLTSPDCVLTAPTPNPQPVAPRSAIYDDDMEATA